MKIVALILAGGIGKRMGATTSKQLIKIKDKYIIEITLEKFQNNDNIDEIILVSNKQDLKFLQETICPKFNKIKSTVVGGNERHNSVYNALKFLDSDVDYVLIHDGVRPFVTNSCINNVIKETIEFKATVLGVPCKSTIKSAYSNNIVKETLNRSELFEIQTPQCFEKNLILEAYENLQNSDLFVTDDASVVELFGKEVKIVPGDYNNIKITTTEDLNFSRIISNGGN